jgi:hypothetical protein
MDDKSSLSAHESIKPDDHIELKARIPAELLEKIQLAAQAKFASSFDDTIIVLLRKGLTAVAPDVKQRLLDQIDQFDAP